MINHFIAESFGQDFRGFSRPRERRDTNTSDELIDLTTGSDLVHYLTPQWILISQYLNDIEVYLIKLKKGKNCFSSSKQTFNSF